MRGGFIKAVELLVAETLHRHGVTTGKDALEIVRAIVDQVEREPEGCMGYIVRNSHLAVRTLAEVEKRAILDAMILCRGDLQLAAQQLGISRQTLYRKLSHYQRADNVPG